MKVPSTTLIAFSGLLSLASALPAVRRDSSENEPAVEAPNGTPITLTYSSAPTGVDNSNSDCSGGDCSNSTDSLSSSLVYNTMTDTMMSDTTTMMDDSTSTMMFDTTTTMMSDTTSTMMSDATSTMMSDSTTTMMSDSTTMAWDSMYTADATSTYMTSMATATYGSGYTPSNYDNCVQQCMASYAPPPSMVTATPSYPPPSDNTDNSVGNGATHTVIVAPTQGVLRYVPFAVNASVGDTVRFIWGAGPHTVTKSSQFNLCNVTSDAPFKSGLQNKSFVFDQVINDTTPTFYYCGVPGHCEKGMFGIINPPNAQPGAQNAAQSMMGMMAQNNSDIAAQWSYTMMNTQNNTAAFNWGGNMDISSITTDPTGQMTLLQNVMYTRLAMAANNQYITSDGGFNPNIAQGMSVPVDPTKLSTTGTNNVASTPSGSGSTSPTSSSSAPSSSTTGKSAAPRNTASSATAIFAAVAIAALVL